MEQVSYSSPNVQESPAVEINVPEFVHKINSSHESPSKKTSHASYRISTTVNRPFGNFKVGTYNVWRRYNDFLSLNTHLSKVFETSILPPLPPTRGFALSKLVNELDEEFLNRRRLSLQKYISSILRDPLLGMDSELAYFLQEDEFGTGEKPASSMLGSKRLEEVINEIKVHDMDPKISDIYKYSEQLR
eukprot:Sdes_comp9104_c0_seq1m565